MRGKDLRRETVRWWVIGERPNNRDIETLMFNMCQSHLLELYRAHL